MLQLKAVVIGVCGVVVRRADGVCCVNVRFEGAGAREDGREPAWWWTGRTEDCEGVFRGVRLCIAKHVEVGPHHLCCVVRMILAGGPVCSSCSDVCLLVRLQESSQQVRGHVRSIICRGSSVLCPSHLHCESDKSGAANVERR